MGLKKLTFDEALNTAKDDAFFNWYLTNKTNGIFNDLGGKCEATSSNGKITFKDGFVSIYGRRIYIENGTNISVSLDSTKKGYVILKVDTINNEASLTLKEGTSSNYPSLTQTNLLESDGVFEFPMVGYSKTTTSLTLDKSVIKYIETNQTKIDSNYDTLNKKINSKVEDLEETIEGKQHGMLCYFSGITKQSGDLFYYDLSAIMKTHSEGLLCFKAGGSFIAVAIPMIRSQSSFTFDYRYLNTWYQGSIEYSNYTVTIEVANEAHLHEYVYYYY